jgi:hypothetical protein
MVKGEKEKHALALSLFTIYPFTRFSFFILFILSIPVNFFLIENSCRNENLLLSFH